MLRQFISLLVCFAIGQVKSLPRTGPQQRGVTSSSKAGLAWPNGNADDITQYTSTGKVSWYYTWSPNPTGADLEFVPMLWGTDQIDAFTSTINKTITSKQVTAVLAFNEPQQPAQSNLTVEEGAQLWKTYIEPLKAQGLRLGTPAPSSAPSGKTWIQGWLSACAGGCNPDFIALHWYDINATQFQLYLEDFHNTFNLPIWVTEWADQNFNNGPQPSSSDVFSFLNQTQSFMDATEWVERYAWYGVMENLNGVDPDNAMMDSNGKITALGKQYIGETSGGSSSGSGPTIVGSVLPRSLIQRTTLLLLFASLLATLLLAL
ncbi:glycoside hydrolase [Fomitiporia mediterranea MF3/22]|uniref:glycoside hydrolase n=1 Tax=Fomitiporia mediterranea (strain MF3/22) TaxID=694068 RepID=UPI0004408A06|nr:glycoside hydrolase [Fomitiporia mediterranea MF3/22]EJD07367.1 glycoside hydrolase [Fomitiporia mediterranea MF3/22]